ncbi:hypothetical protein H8788_02535 [Parabacteroides faecis]|uniref:hypothetical protein n=1 Tax=Parabacteroides TaxID=375288 RepID=UPI001313DF76|nr:MULTISPECIES: hypothetical protein [Parabacteroides]MBC8616601.1 hypothetical protein [Parabacteroides faecis]
MILNEKDWQQYMEVLRDQRSVIKTGWIEGKAGNLHRNDSPMTSLSIEEINEL